MKRTLSVLLSICMVLCLCSCDSDQSVESSDVVCYSSFTNVPDFGSAEGYSLLESDESEGVMYYYYEVKNEEGLSDLNEALEKEFAATSTEYIALCEDMGYDIILNDQDSMSVVIKCGEQCICVLGNNGFSTTENREVYLLIALVGEYDTLYDSLGLSSLT